ncbi:hypothetical protein NUU61_000901 [Penicillium alfredii]|uniref:Aminodeoxychorismate lyase n=1 Tax=Penicillium alfredii TaxID=1506179 RepID=A0A9W9KRC8_9EURO|nr:uncharacterized protein NUU61_000901 [Penicillium alfredii]KAJ5115142.1 hypothetical protein NUU61_000901 [Penicillium alfredii]
MSSSLSADQMQAFQIISSLRYDPGLPEVVSRHANDYPEPRQSPYYLLAYHRDRLITAAQHFQWGKALAWLQRDIESLEEILNGSLPDQSKPWRLRIAIDSNGHAAVDVHPTAAIEPQNLLVPSLHASIESPVWRVYVDTQPTIPSGFTTHKTTARDDYTAARLRAGITSPAETAEVLVVNPNDEIMEGSITTPYFRRRETRTGSQQGPNQAGSWVTPPLSNGGNAGTTRRYALSQKFCVEQVLSRADLVDGEECWLSNGVRGFMRGIVVLNR